MPQPADNEEVIFLQQKVEKGTAESRVMFIWQKVEEVEENKPILQQCSLDWNGTGIGVVKWDSKSPFCEGIRPNFHLSKKPKLDDIL